MDNNIAATSKTGQLRKFKINSPKMALAEIFMLVKIQSHLRPQAVLFPSNEEAKVRLRPGNFQLIV